MLSRIASLSSIAVAAVLFTSCGGNSGLAVLPKSKIRGMHDERRDFTLPGPSQDLVSASQSKPRDKHSMPVYTFSERRRVVRTTAYTCSEDDHLIYGNKNATGTPLRYTNRVRSAAADWSFYPVGTTFRMIDDYGSALTGTGTVDIYKPNKEVMNIWGRRNVELTIVQWGSFNRSAEILSQRTKHDHCRKMLANIIRQRPDLGRVAMR
ncbi:MAG: hypothetical protein MUC40_05705 [Akkermansiaceae bacterium]|nr:hypothetical protein [Akkermansiaceae bacterium]